MLILLPLKCPLCPGNQPDLRSVFLWRFSIVWPSGQVGNHDYLTGRNIRASGNSIHRSGSGMRSMQKALWDTVIRALTSWSVLIAYKCDVWWVGPACFITYLINHGPSLRRVTTLECVLLLLTSCLHIYESLSPWQLEQSCQVDWATRPLAKYGASGRVTWQVAVFAIIGCMCMLLYLFYYESNAVLWI